MLYLRYYLGLLTRSDTRRFTSSVKACSLWSAQTDCSTPSSPPTPPSGAWKRAPKPQSARMRLAPVGVTSSPVTPFGLKQSQIQV